MKTLETAWARLGFEAPAVVERFLVRGTSTGALMSLAIALSVHSRLYPRELSAFIVASTAALLLLVLPRQTLAARAGVGAGAVAAALVIPWTPVTLPYFFTVPLGAVLAYEASTPVRKLVAFAGPSLGGAWCVVVANWLSLRHLHASWVFGWAALLSTGLFISAGAALAWVTFAADTVQPRLTEEPKVLAAWLKLRAALQKVPKGGAKDRLESLALEGAERCLKAVAQRDEVVRSLDETQEIESREAVTAIEARLAETADDELKVHLAQLLRVHRDTLEQLDGLRRKIERQEARVAAETGWLETAAFSVDLSPKSETSLGDLHHRLERLSPSPC